MLYIINFVLAHFATDLITQDRKSILFVFSSCRSFWNKMTFAFKSAVFLLASFGNVAFVASESFEFPLSRNLSFFGKFASQHNQNKFDGRLECVYGDPVKGKMCPPVMEDPRAQIELEKGESTLEKFSRCLDDPDDPKCREIQVGQVSPATNVAQAPAHLRNLFGATLSPTTDDCGGNMFDPRFCASQMPSISAAPTEDEDSGDQPSYYRIVGTMEPTLCPERKMSPFVKTEGGESCPVLFSDDALPIVVEKTTMDTVTVKLANTFPATSSLTALAMTYPDKAGKTTCTVISKADVGAMSEPIEAKCDASGFVRLEVFATSPGFKSEVASAVKPASCSAIKNKDPACAYIIAIPCACDEEATGVPTIDSTTAPSTTAPSAGPSAVPTIAGTQCEGRDVTVHLHLLSGKCTLQMEEPIVLASRTDKVAILELFQEWADEVDFISALFKQSGETVCASDAGVTKAMTEKTPLTYTIDCGPGDWATMYLYVKKNGFKSTGFVEMPSVCAEQDFVESSEDICSYKVTVSCLCNPEAPSTSPSFAPSFSPSAAPSFAPSTMPSAAPSAMPSSAPSSAPSAELETRRIRSLATEGNYHCSLGKYGCSDGPNHVEICHYSSRTGYKTYCVPQSDSEIV